MRVATAVRHEIDVESQTRCNRAVAALAAAQYGVVSGAQLASLGLGRGAVHNRVARGLLHPVHRGVYAVGHLRLPRGGHWMAAVLAVGAGAVLSHRSAAELWGIRNGARYPIEVIAPRRRPGVQARHILLPSDEVTIEQGIPTTSPARTLFDLASVVTPQQLEHALNEAEIRRLTSPLPLDALIARHPRRKGTTALKRALEKQRQRGETVLKSTMEQANGYRVVRITWRQLRREPNRLAGELRTLLGDTVQPP